MAAEKDDLEAVWEVLPPADAAALQAALAPPPPPPPLAEDDDEPAPWLRRQDETLAEYAAFQRFLAVGTSRTFARFVRQEAPLEGDGVRGAWHRWHATAQRLAWTERATAYDEYQAGLELAAYRAERLALRKERQAVLRAYLRVIAGQIQKLGQNPRLQADLGEITAALRVVMPELRTEYLDEPEDRALEGKDGKQVVQITDIQVFMRQMRARVGD